MQSKLVFKDFNVNFLYKPRLKHTYISIDSKKIITIKSSNKSEKFLFELLKSKEKWIEKQFLKLERCNHLELRREDEILLFGELYSIDSLEARSLREKIEKSKNITQDKVVRLYNDFYKQLSVEYISQRVDFFAQKMGLKYKLLKYRKMKSRWGSCSSQSVLTFNSELMKINKQLIDYVVVHELAHLVHMNHSKEFHSLVESYLPNSKELRSELKLIRLV